MNRCGVPLVEIVTEPVMGSAREAESFLRELHRLLVFIGVTQGRMHEGDMRFDCNVSLSRRGGADLGTPTEIKNLNSFRSVRGSLEREIERQAAVLEAGGAVDRETMLWDQPSGSLVIMRSKEASRDYRYMTEPDLPAFTVDESMIARVSSSVPETPGETVERLKRDHGLSIRRARSVARSPELVLLFDLTVAALGRELPGTPPGDAGRVADWVTGVMPGILRKHGRSLPKEPALACRLADDLSSLLAARHRGEVTEASARHVLESALSRDRTVLETLRAGDVSPISSEEALVELVRSILDDHGAEVERVLSGESRLRSFFMGQIMRQTRGRADPRTAARVLDTELARRRK
jgi:aspartyl-tRNA(Asn)/glutamyl-tRNA(Gln) amidotransferase subunit B